MQRRGLVGLVLLIAVWLAGVKAAYDTLPRDWQDGWQCGLLMASSVALFFVMVAVADRHFSRCEARGKVAAELERVAIRAVQLRRPEGFAEGIHLEAGLEALVEWEGQSRPYRDEWHAVPYPQRSGFDWYTGDPYVETGGGNGLALWWLVTYKRTSESGSSRQANWVVLLAPSRVAPVDGSAEALEERLAHMSLGMKRG